MATPDFDADRVPGYKVEEGTPTSPTLLIESEDEANTNGYQDSEVDGHSDLTHPFERRLKWGRRRRRGRYGRKQATVRPIVRYEQYRYLELAEHGPYGQAMFDMVPTRRHSLEAAFKECLRIVEVNKRAAKRLGASSQESKEELERMSETLQHLRNSL